MTWKKWYTTVLVIMTGCLLSISASPEELTIPPEEIINGSSSTEELTMPPEEIIDGGYVDTWTVEYPFFINGDPPGSSCGGSLIADNLVLTAAHCCLNSYNYNDPTINSIAFKKDYLITIAPVFKDGYHVTAVIGEVFVHPQYNDVTGLDLDFCILKLKNPVQNAVTICLPKKSSRAPALGDILTVIGFGATITGVYSPPPILKEASTTVIPCTSLVGIEGITIADFTNNMYCTEKAPSTTATQAPPGNSCQGDSGGPIFDKYGIQVGVVSWGPSCSVLLSVDANVPSALPWIEKVAKYADSKIDKKDCWKPRNVGSKKKGNKSGRRLHSQTRVERTKGGKRKEAINQFEINPNGQIFSTTSKGVYNNHLDGRKV